MATYRWRRGIGGYYHYEDGQYGVGYVHPCDDGYFASVMTASKTFTLLQDAKRWVERKISKRAKSRDRQ